MEQARVALLSKEQAFDVALLDSVSARGGDVYGGMLHDAVAVATLGHGFACCDATRGLMTGLSLVCCFPLSRRLCNAPRTRRTRTGRRRTSS